MSRCVPNLADLDFLQSGVQCRTTLQVQGLHFTECSRPEEPLAPRPGQTPVLLL